MKWKLLARTATLLSEQVKGLRDKLPDGCPEDIARLIDGHIATAEYACRRVSYQCENYLTRTAART